MATEIPTPEEITRVTAYLQMQAGAAQETIIAAKQAGAKIAEKAANDLVVQNDVSGVTITRKPWDDTKIPWQTRGDIISIRLDFTDGQQALVTVAEDSDSLNLSIVNPAG